MKDIEYYWIKFYSTGDWQVVKFWSDSKGRKFLKGLDWGAEQSLDNFSNESYILGPRIHIPD